MAIFTLAKAESIFSGCMGHDYDTSPLCDFEYRQLQSCPNRFELLDRHKDGNKTTFFTKDKSVILTQTEEDIDTCLNDKTTDLTDPDNYDFTQYAPRFSIASEGYTDNYTLITSVSSLAVLDLESSSMPVYCEITNVYHGDVNRDGFEDLIVFTSEVDHEDNDSGMYLFILFNKAGSGDRDYYINEEEDKCDQLWVESEEDDYVGGGCSVAGWHMGPADLITKATNALAVGAIGLFSYLFGD